MVKSVEMTSIVWSLEVKAQTVIKGYKTTAKIFCQRHIIC